MKLWNDVWFSLSLVCWHSVDIWHRLLCTMYDSSKWLFYLSIYLSIGLLGVFCIVEECYVSCVLIKLNNLLALNYKFCLIIADSTFEAYRIQEVKATKKQ